MGPVIFSEEVTSFLTLSTNAFIFSLAGKPAYSGSSTPIRNAKGLPLRPLPHGSNPELFDVRVSNILGGNAILSPSPWIEVACSFHPCANNILLSNNEFSLSFLAAEDASPLTTFATPNLLSTPLTHVKTRSKILAFRSPSNFFSRNRFSARIRAACASRRALVEAERALREARERASADFWSFARRWAAISKSILVYRPDRCFGNVVLVHIVSRGE